LSKNDLVVKFGKESKGTREAEGNDKKTFMPALKSASVMFRDYLYGKGRPSKHSKKNISGAIPKDSFQRALDVTV
jgi:hypothetical protein